MANESWRKSGEQMIEIPDKVYLSTFNTEPKGDERYVIVVNDSDLQEKIIKGTSYTTMKIADTKDAVHYAELIIKSLDSGGYARDYTFLLASIDKGPKAAFIKELDNRNLRIDKSAYKIFYGKNDPVYCEPEEIAGFIAEYIGSNSNSSDTAEKPKSNSLDVVTMDEAEEKNPEWLILDYIPKNQITTIAGDGGSGKTTMWCAIAAAVSRGEYWFLSDEYPFDKEPDKPQKVMFFSAEDSYEYTLKRRLRKNGAVLKNIMTIDLADDRFKDIKFDSDFLERLVAEYRPTLLIFDPIQAFLDSSVRMGERNAMRCSLTPLAGFGKKYGCTTLIVVHSNKQSGVWGRKRIADSADIWDISRSVLMVGETDQKGVRYLSHEKSNYGMTADTVLFSINDDVIEIKGKTDKKDRDFVERHTFNKTQAPRLEEAKEFILDFLKDGEKEVAELDGMAKAMGITKETLKNAKTELSKNKTIRYRATGNKDNKKFYCSLTAS